MEEEKLKRSMDAFCKWRNKPLSKREQMKILKFLLEAPPLITREEVRRNLFPTLNFEDIHLGLQIDEVFQCKQD